MDTNIPTTQSIKQEIYFLTRIALQIKRKRNENECQSRKMLKILLKIQVRILGVKITSAEKIQALERKFKFLDAIVNNEIGAKV